MIGRSYWLELRAEELEHMRFLLELGKHNPQLYPHAVEVAKISSSIAMKYKELYNKTTKS